MFMAFLFIRLEYRYIFVRMYDLATRFLFTKCLEGGETNTKGDGDVVVQIRIVD